MITKNLNDETVTEYRAELDKRRTALATAVTAELDYEELQRLLEGVIKAEAWVKTVAYAVRLRSLPKLTDEVIAFRLMSDLTTGADDRWSGRGNDAKRTYFDAKLDATNRIVEKLLAGTDFI